jgi:hypothetical protein
MDNTGFYESSFAILMLVCFMSPILVYFFDCLIGYTSPARRLDVKQIDRELKEFWHQKREPAIITPTRKPTTITPTRKPRVQSKRESGATKRHKPVKSIKTPKKTKVRVKRNDNRGAKVNPTTPKPEKIIPKNDNLIKESVKALKSLGYKSGEVKQTLQKLCISNQFKNSESLIEAFFKSR